MSDIDQLMGELNRLDDQVAICIREFEERLATRLTISVEVKFRDGLLAWMKHDSKWQLVFTKNEKHQPLLSASRHMRVEAVNGGLDLLLDQIETSLRDNITERKQTLESFESTRQKLTRLIGQP